MIERLLQIVVLFQQNWYDISKLCNNFFGYLFIFLYYVQVLTLQGPWSERDAQMTETFARLEDIYGAGRVLGILGKYIRNISTRYDPGLI